MGDFISWLTCIFNIIIILIADFMFFEHYCKKYLIKYNFRQEYRPGTTESGENFGTQVAN